MLVRQGIRAEDKVQILSGLNAGDKVIVAGGVGLEDGAKIVVGEAKPEAGSKAGAKQDAGNHD